MQWTIEAYREDVLRRIDYLIDKKASIHREDLDDDFTLLSAVERNLEVIGEALNQANRVEPIVSEGITNFRMIVGFRHVLAYGYFQIDNDLIWDTLSNDLQPLRAQVEALITTYTE